MHIHLLFQGMIILTYSPRKHTYCIIILNISFPS